MRRSVLTFGLVAVVLLVLVVLNVMFMSQPKETENEANGDRSSYRATPYGTLAYYTLLSERGYSVERFEKPYTALAGTHVGTLFIVVPKASLQPSEEEITALESWVGDGGNLVIVDREINLDTKMGSIRTDEPLLEPVAPSAPSAYTRGVGELELTPYASRVTEASRESVVQIAGKNGALLLDKPYGEGHVTLLAEPYVLQNNGIGKKDNLALAMNLVDGVRSGRSVAFDEYHHGHGNASVTESDGGLRAYIANTPVPWILAQLGLVALVVAISIGARFARPVPLKTTRRTSALEFVSSMANIQRLARASDLAVENVYSSFRSRLCRYANLPSDAPPAELARAAASRGRIDRDQLLSLLERCERILGERTQPAPQELLDLVTELRAVEAALRI